MSIESTRMINKVKQYRDNRPDVVDDLTAALELFPLRPGERIENWLHKRWEDGSLVRGDYVYLDFMTCEC